MGVIELAASAAISVTLWSSHLGPITRLRRSVERKWTMKHLGRIQAAFEKAQADWERDQVRPTLAVRTIAALLRPLRLAYRLAGERTQSEHI